MQSAAVRTIEAVSDALEAGAARVLLGTAALDERFLATIVARFGDRVAVAVDVRDGALAVAGWTRTTKTDAVQFAERCAALGVAQLVATATARDGTLAGPDLAAARAAPRRRPAGRRRRRSRLARRRARRSRPRLRGRRGRQRALARHPAFGGRAGGYGHGMSEHVVAIWSDYI